MGIAIKYRQEFSRDVFIDLLGYRKYGHNEGDEPKFTQPKLYKGRLHMILHTRFTLIILLKWSNH